MATTQTLNAKYPDWTKEDWDSFRWIKSLDFGFSSPRPPERTHGLKLRLYMIPIMPDEEFQKLSDEERNAQWDRELDSMTEEDWDRFYFNCTGRHLGDPIPPEELVDMDEFFENPDAFQ